MVLRLASRSAAAAADELLQAERLVANERRVRQVAKRRRREAPDDFARANESVDSAERQHSLSREGFVVAHAAAEAAEAANLRELARDPRLREAITWQSPHALAAVDRREGRRGAVGRRLELLARYLQRYATKNDSIGFFGPVGWASFEDRGPAVTISAGSEFLASRGVYFEHWGIDRLAQCIAKDERFAPWLAPRRLPFVRIEDDAAQGPLGGRQALEPEWILLLRACDGRSSARRLAARFVGDSGRPFGDEASVFAALRAMQAKQLLVWTLEVPLIWDPQDVLRTRLDMVEDESLRKEALDKLARLERGRRNVAAGAGDAQRLESAIRELGTSFTELTGEPPSRNPGATYGARSLVFEDCRRDVRVGLGPDVLSRIGPALALLLQSARWVSVQIASAYRDMFRELYEQLRPRSSSPALPFAPFWFRAQSSMFGANRNPVRSAIAELQRNWSEILAVPSGEARADYDSRALAPAVDRVFRAAMPGWRRARYNSPDILVAAKGADAINRGDFVVVLGELHLATNTLDAAALVHQHPSPSDLARWTLSDIPDARYVPVSPKDGPNITLRTETVLAGTKDFFLEKGFEASGKAPDRVLALGDLTVHDAGGALYVRSPDGRVSEEIVEFMGETLSDALVQAFRGPLAPAPHIPRVTIDGLVIARESWTYRASSVPFDSETPARDRFLAARRWMHAAGLPRFVFVKGAVEAKPVFVDFESPVLVGHFARIVRRCRTDAGGRDSVVLSEMLPSIEDTWLTDAAGQRYTCELRMVTVDRSA